MFENPHGVTDLTEQDAANLSELYGVSLIIQLSMPSYHNSYIYYLFSFTLGQEIQRL